jgi:hypothetical protein
LNKADLRSQFQGDLVLIKGDKVINALIGNTYYSGHLPLWTLAEVESVDKTSLADCFPDVGVIDCRLFTVPLFTEKGSERLKANEPKDQH